MFTILRRTRTSRNRLQNLSTVTAGQALDLMLLAVGFFGFSALPVAMYQIMYARNLTRGFAALSA